MLTKIPQSEKFIYTSSTLSDTYIHEYKKDSFSRWTLQILLFFRFLYSFRSDNKLHILNKFVLIYYFYFILQGQNWNVIINKSILHLEDNNSR